MMSMPPSNPSGRPIVSSSSSSGSVSGPPRSPNGNGDVRQVENDLRKIDDNLTDLIDDLRKEGDGSKFLEALKKMEAELNHIISSLKKQFSPNKLHDELKKMEDELKEIKEKKILPKLDEKDKEALNVVQGDVASVLQHLQQLAAPENIKPESLAGINTHKEVSKTIQLIQKMVSQIHVGTVGGVHFTSVELKETTEVPSFFANATINITPGADGKMTVQFSNLTAEQERAAIYAIQQHPELLLDLLNRVPLNRLQIGDHIVTLPTPESAREEGGRGGREGREQGQQGEDRERRER